MVLTDAPNDPMRICLIVDNPLRDLDGLILLARTLMTRGLEPHLVPMYSQAFAVAALRPDLIVVNYVRPNNIGLIREYRRRGIRVAVLDTEGAGGRNAEEFADLVRHGGAPGNVDLYCVWGPAQAEALAPLLGSAVVLTGCPRYDYCASPWRASLDDTGVEPGYILVNTNYPTVNPRFSAGAQSERDVAIRTGFSSEFAARYFPAAQRTMDGVTALIGDIARARPHVRFVLRPHPFENADSYSRTLALPNVTIRQSGTSLDWLTNAAALLHLNCSTAIEAVMLGIEPLSPRWLDADILRVPGPSEISRFADDRDAFLGMIDDAVAGATLPITPALAAARDRVVRDHYFVIDGNAAERVAEAISTCLGAPPPTSRARAAVRTRVIGLVQRLLGEVVWERAIDLISRGTMRPRRQAKSFSVEQVARVLARLDAVDPTIESVAMASTRRGGGIVVRARSTG